MRLLMGGSSAVRKLDAGQAPCAGVSACGARVLRSMRCSWVESRVAWLRNEEPHPFNVGCGRWMEAFEMGNSKWGIWGCAQCAHFCCRTGSYWGWIGPDSACFSGSPAFTRAGMQFESHLGHALPLVRGVFAFNVLTLTLRGSLCLWPRSVPGTAVAYEVVWVAGSGPWLVGPLPAGIWGSWPLFPGSFGGRGWPSLIHCQWLC